MVGKLARSVAAATILVGITMAGSGLQASATMTPQVGQGEEIVITYYSDATHSTVIGGYEFGCVFASWGSNSSYHTTNEYAC
jgi:hypothetical protein